MGYEGIHTGSNDDVNRANTVHLDSDQTDAKDPDFTPEEIMADATAGLEYAGYREVPPEDWTPSPDDINRANFRHIRVGDEFKAHEDVPFSTPSEEDNLPVHVEKMSNALLGGDLRAERARMGTDPHHRRMMSIAMLLGAIDSHAKALSGQVTALLLGIDYDIIMQSGISALNNLGVTDEEIQEAMNMEIAGRKRGEPRPI